MFRLFALEISPSSLKNQFSNFLKHPRWKRELSLNYQEKLASETDCSNALRRLELFKESM